jgi:NAD-dependent dihydropyrimidine dehydrogenase PreA subunit
MSKENECIYRTTVTEWLNDFLEDGIIRPTEGHQFISLSFRPDSGGKISGGARIVFDGEKIRQQGATPIDYDRCGLDVASHIVGMDEHEFAQLSEREKHYFLYDVDLEKYRCEEEVVIPEITYRDGLIEKVCFWSEESMQAVKDELDQKNIDYALGFDKCDNIEC